MKNILSITIGGLIFGLILVQACTKEPVAGDNPFDNINRGDSTQNGFPVTPNSSPIFPGHHGL